MNIEQLKISQNDLKLSDQIQAFENLILLKTIAHVHWIDVHGIDI